MSQRDVNILPSPVLLERENGLKKPRDYSPKQTEIIKSVLFTSILNSRRCKTLFRRTLCLASFLINKGRYFTTSRSLSMFRGTEREQNGSFRYITSMFRRSLIPSDFFKRILERSKYMRSYNDGCLRIKKKMSLWVPKSAIISEIWYWN